MKSYIFSIFLLVPVFASAEDIDCDNAMPTYEMNMCAGKKIEAKNSRLSRYYLKAKEKYAAQPSVVETLEKAQTAWFGYRKAHCDAIYAMWSGGTIRGVMFSDCMLQLTKQRTHTIWEDYIATMDSAPPLLPEPR